MVLVVPAGPTRVAMLTLAMPPLPGPIMVLIPPWCHKRQVPRPRCRPLQDLPLPVIATGALAWKQSMEHALTRPWDGQALLRVAEGSIRFHSFAYVGIVATRRVPGGPCLGLCRCLRTLRLRSLRRDVEDLEEGADCDDATRPSRGLLNLLACEEDRHGCRCRQERQGSTGAACTCSQNGCEYMCMHVHVCVCACMCVCACACESMHVLSHGQSDAWGCSGRCLKSRENGSRMHKCKAHSGRQIVTIVVAAVMDAPFFVPQRVEKSKKPISNFRY